MRADPISVGGDDGIVHVAQSLVVQVGEPILDSLLKFKNAVFIVAEFDFDDGLVQGMKDSVSRLILAEAPVLIAEDLVQRRRLKNAKRESGVFECLRLCRLTEQSKKQDATIAPVIRLTQATQTITYTSQRLHQQQQHQRRRPNLTKFDGVIVENFVGGDCVGFAIYSRRIEDIDGAQLLDDLQRLLVTRMQPAQRHSHGFRGRLEGTEKSRKESTLIQGT